MNLISRLLFEENRLLATGAKQDTIKIRATEKKCYKRSNTDHLRHAKIKIISKKHVVSNVMDI